MSGLRGLYPKSATNNPGEVRISGSFVVNGASAPTEANIKGTGFTVSPPSTGVYTVTLTKGVPRGRLAAFAHLSNGGANNTKRADVRSEADLDVGGTFTIATQSNTGTDANLSGGEIVNFQVVVREGDATR